MNKPIVSLPAVFLALFLALFLVGCDDDPFAIQWEENPGETVLFSLDRPELNRPAAFNMAERRRVILENPGAEGRWDFALDRQDGGFVLLPPRVLGVVSRAGIVPVPGVRWDDVREAPADTLQYLMEEPVPVELGTIYVVRTHEQVNVFGQRCTFFGKLEPLELNLEEGTLWFTHETSPECNSRRLVPPGS